jgi:hypothetical protein
MFILILEIIGIFFSGILAGLEIAAHYGFHKPMMVLDEKSHIVFRQGVIRILRWLVPVFFMPTAVIGIALLFIHENTAGFLFHLIAVIAIVVWIYVRIVATVKINSATLEWNPDQPPRNWKELINRAEQFHTVGAWVSILIFISFLLALAIQLRL